MGSGGHSRFSSSLFVLCVWRCLLFSCASCFTCRPISAFASAVSASRAFVRSACSGPCWTVSSCPNCIHSSRCCAAISFISSSSALYSAPRVRFACRTASTSIFAFPNWSAVFLCSCCLRSQNLVSSCVLYFLRSACASFSCSTIIFACSSTFHRLKDASVTSEGAPVAIGDGLGEGVRASVPPGEGFGWLIDEWKVAETGMATE
jgi:hypothetical protein